MDPSGESAVTMRAVADRGACCGYGVCAEICPEVFKLDDAGLVYLEEPIVPAELIERATEAAEACPQLALRIEAIED